jgi:hypothetical protein
MAKRKMEIMGTHVPTLIEQEHRRWCINKDIKISPSAASAGVWYIDIAIRNKINRSPKLYDKKDVWIELYKFYKYYYEKYKDKI